ncbi:hypothetical protein LCGC14_0313430 [marine sediment metagenome]|uniref:Uncharacterized protein n=1 Tax=marine sediment metagenome TaxID=412755 RepID=A0A0F9W8R9_9ZZZZ
MVGEMPTGTDVTVSASEGMITIDAGVGIEPARTGMSQALLLGTEPPPIAEPKKLTKVAVLGFTESWKLAPFDDPEWEIWGLNELYMLIPRWTRWFELHRREIYEADKGRTHEHIQKLQAMTVPVYMQQHWEDIPQSVVYPLTEIIHRYGDPEQPYLTNSISYMIALAMMEGFEEIGVFGVDMAHDTEYQSQRPSCEYYIGYARGMGIKVTIPAQSDLLKAAFLYGYQSIAQSAFQQKLQARETELQQKLNELDQQIANLTGARDQYRGAIQDTQHIKKIWVPPQDIIVGNGPKPQ